MKKYVVFYSPLNNPKTTVNILVKANNKQEALKKAEKSTKSKAKKSVTLYKPLKK